MSDFRIFAFGISMTFRTSMAFTCVWMIAAVAPAQPSLAKLEQDAFKAAAAEVAPSLVQIQTFGGLDKVGDTLTGRGRRPASSFHPTVT